MSPLSIQCVVQTYVVLVGFLFSTEISATEANKKLYENYKSMLRQSDSINQVVERSGNTIMFNDEIDHCGSASTYALGFLDWSRQQKGEQLGFIAYWALSLHRGLLDAGLKRSDVLQLVNSFEGRALSIVGLRMDAFEREFMKAIVSMFSSAKKMYPVLRFKGKPSECGGGEVEVWVKSHPEGGTIYFIPRFFFRACELSGIDPYDRNACDGWSKVNGRKMYVAGDYNYLITWKDGRTSKDIFHCKAKCHEDGGLFVLR